MEAYFMKLEGCELKIETDRYKRIHLTKTEKGDVYENVFSVRYSRLFVGFLEVAAGTKTTIELKTRDYELYFDVLDRIKGKYNVHINSVENKLSFNIPLTYEQLEQLLTNCFNIVFQ